MKRNSAAGSGIKWRTFAVEAPVGDAPRLHSRPTVPTTGPLKLPIFLKVTCFSDCTELGLFLDVPGILIVRAQAARRRNIRFVVPFCASRKGEPMSAAIHAFRSKLATDANLQAQVREAISGGCGVEELVSLAGAQ